MVQGKIILHNIEDQFQSAQWVEAAKIERPFVKHENSETSPGKVWSYTLDGTPISLSVVIPTIDASREGYFPKLLSQIGCQQFQGFEVIVIYGDSRQGRAINIGALLARGKYMLTLDDDTSLPDTKTFCKLVDAMEAHPEVGIAGANNIIPSNATPFIRRAMTQIPRRSWEPVSRITVSDLAEHPCMIMRTEEFKAVGGENELIPRGLDPYLRQEFRKLGKLVVVIPEVIYHHLPPGNFQKLCRQFFRNGYQASFVSRNCPKWMIETPSTHGSFQASKSFQKRVIRFPITLLQALKEQKFIWFICEIAYSFGFIWGFLCHRK